MNQSAAERPQCVLVVDDDETVRALLGGIMNDLGYTTLVASEGAEALELFAANNVDLIITDAQMPNINGFELCSMVRIMPGGDRVQIMFLTGRNDIDTIQRAYEFGANDFSIKNNINPLLIGERVRFQLRAQTLQDNLRLSEQRLSYAQRLAQLGHWERTLDGRTVAVSSIVLQMLGFDETSKLSWDSLCAMIHPDDLRVVQLSMQRALTQRGVFRLEHRLRSVTGKLLVLRHQGEVATNPDGEWVVRSTVQDVTETRAQEDRIRFLALHDPLTALPNRESALHSLHQAIGTSALNGSHVGVFAVAIDDFARIGTSLGQSISDAVLKTVGDRLRSQIRDSDHLHQDLFSIEEACLVVSRAEGERFLCIVGNLSMRESAIGIAARLQRAVAAPIDFGDTQLQLSASIGVSIYPQDGARADELIDNASAALLHSPGTKGHCQFFATEISHQARERLTLENELRQALDSHQFVMHYQPRLDLRDNRIHGAEALVRWLHPTRGLVLPGEFIPLLEDMNLIGELGNQVIDMVVEQSAIWRQRFGRQFRLSFNISPLQFSQPNLLQRLDSALLMADARAENLEVEITESALMVQSEVVIQTMEQLRSRGVRLALDDFGTGFSSLSYLRKLPLDVLKIDRTFVADIGVTHSGASLVTAILSMAAALNLECVAEGVEMETQLHFLSANHCHEVQGFLLSKALPADDFDRWMDHWHAGHVHEQIA